MNKMKVYAYLLDTRCYLSDDGTANVVVPGDDTLKKTVLSRNESVEVITEAIRDTLGIPVNVKIIDENKMKNQTDNSNDDPLLEKIKQFATENGIPLKIEE